MVTNMNLLEVRRRILLNTPHIESASGNPAIFSTDMAANLKECKIRFTPVQAGEGTPSPENVRPISGWDGVTVTYVDDKNIFIKENMTKACGCLNSSGNWVNSSEDAGWKVTEYIPISGLIVYDGITTPGNLPHNVWYDSEKNVISTFKFSVGRTVVIPPNNAAFVRFSVIQQPRNNIFDQDTFVLNTGISTSISFPQTIFGGYVDLIKGEIVEEWTKITLPTTGWSKQSYNVFSHPISGRQITISTTDSGLVCDRYNTYITIPITQLNMLPDISICGRSTYSTVFIRDTKYDNASDFQSSLVDAELAYKLATPNVYPLTPQSIKALKGLNNLYSDANGNVEVKFWSHEQYQTLSGEYEITNDNYLLTTNDGYVIDF